MRNKLLSVLLIMGMTLFSTLQAQRPMENLGRGVVAVRTGTTSAFVSWRLLGLDPAGIGFNVYRSTAGGTAVKLNSTVLTTGTNYTDATADLTKANAYFVKPVISGVEQEASGSFTIAANALTQPCLVVPLRTPAAGYYTRYVSVGDLDGDGEYDYVLDRVAPFDPTNNDIGLGNQKLEAYKSDGTFLWEVDLGITSRNTYNISPGAATISMGHWDGWTVYDMDNDGKSEVLLKTANDVTFGDGTKLVDGNNINQYVSVLNGMTGAERARIQFPTDFIARGQMGAQFAIAHLNGTTPSLVAMLKNRNADQSFNCMFVTWDFNGSSITQKWKWIRTAGDDGHQMRIADVDGNGTDEVCEVGFCLNGDGTLRYNLGDQGVKHGDRFYIGKFDPTRPGLQGYGIQQGYSPIGILEYYYDASTGALLWANSVDPANQYDVGRGIVGDIDPRYAGTEVWSFQGIYNGPSHTKLTDEPNRPYPCQTFWWDGDLLSEQLNDTKFEKWNYTTNTVGRLLTAYNYEHSKGDGTNPMFMGDIMGDWRTEVIYFDWDYYNKMIIFTTNKPTDSRIYTMAHNPQYRNQLTIKGYLESPLPDYFLGDGMATPAVPNITYGGTASCQGTPIVPYIQVDGGSLQNVSSATVSSGAAVLLSPQPENGGTWSWSGLGTSGTVREQLIYPTNSGVATAIYTNSCGAQTTQTFNITISRTLTTSVVGSGSISPANGVYNEGSVITLTATPSAGYVFTGWSGDVTGTINPLTLTMDANKNITATFTLVSTLVDGDYHIQPLHSGLYLQAGSSAITQEVGSTATSQDWRLAVSGTSYTLYNIGKRKYLNCPSVTLNSYLSLTTGTTNRNFTITDAGSGTYYISPVANAGLTVDVYGASTQTGSKLVLYTNVGANNQKFIFTLFKAAAKVKSEMSINPESENQINEIPYVFKNGNILNINFQLENASEVVIEITDLAGKVLIKKNCGIRELGSYTETIELTDVPRGINIIKLKTNDNSKTLKFIY